MYNGIGLQTSRGSGTSGYVQKNVGVGGKKLQSKEQFLKELQQKRRNNLPPPRKANQAIVEHQRKRQIMIQVLKLRQKLQNEGKTPDEIEQKAQKLQRILNEKLQSGKIQSKTNDTHVLTEAKQKQYMKLSKAFGVTDKRSIGSAFDFEAQREEKLKRQYEKSLQPNFECPKDNCGKVYRQKELLDRHLKYKHPEIYQKLKQLEKEEKKLLQNKQQPKQNKVKDETSQK